MSSVSPTSATITYTLPAGRYFLGDPCYAVKDADWALWLDEARKSDWSILAADIDGYPVIGLSTAYGDGVYSSEQIPEAEFSVDAGLIGLVSEEYALENDRHDPDELERLGAFVTFFEPVACRREENGDLHFGGITIRTGDED